ncbi:MAG: insulinase family protein [Clostridiales bacterium]|jgi:predicted Zn-dependent peptidase|nr:insulinase family protein [Clostridiales bacterium]
MIDMTQYYELTPGVNLHLVKSRKFKTVLYGVYIKRPLNDNEVSLNALLSRVIDKVSSVYPTQMEMSSALENLYGAIIVSDIHKYGEKQLIQIKMQVPGAQYVGEQSVTAQALQFLDQILNRPKIVNGGFDPEIFEAEKLGLISEVEMRKDDKDGWALSLCVENMSEHEPYSIHEYGSVEAIRKITPASLYEHYQKVLRTSSIDVIVIGDFEAEDMKNEIEGNLHFYEGARDVVDREEIIYHPERIKRVEEAHDIAQGKLAMGYRMNIPYESDEYLSAFMATIVLGYGGSSKLFKVVREREGLCYTVFARADKFKSVLLIYAGVDFDKFDKAESLIIEQIEAIKNGEITDSELAIAKKSLISNLQSLSDYQNSYINYYYNQYLTGGTLDLDEYIERINLLEKNDLIMAAKHFELDTIVRLKGEK